MCMIIDTYFDGCRRHPDNDYKACPDSHQCRKKWNRVERVGKISDDPCLVCAVSFQGQPGYPQYNPGTGRQPLSEEDRKRVIMDAASRMDPHGFRTFLAYFVHTDARTRMGRKDGPETLDEVDRMGKQLEMWFWSVVVYMKKYKKEDAPEWVQMRLHQVEASPG
ncbi:hypothetical protein KVT40_005991 [Elsinoe batatas]|uniref:Uncharacterized protein n=1 Tax=Elsinoe batatas TaxID=2601811 RepID=A0A8K0PBB8_9PEZI|nr:hypothetical protein KVT40_005991 [Elsinoe batatas]